MPSEYGEIGRLPGGLLKPTTSYVSRRRSYSYITGAGTEATCSTLWICGRVPNSLRGGGGRAKSTSLKGLLTGKSQGGAKAHSFREKHGVKVASEEDYLRLTGQLLQKTNHGGKRKANGKLFLSSP